MSHPKRMQQSAAADSVIAAKAQYILAELDQLASGSSVALGLRARSDYTRSIRLVHRP